MNILSKITLFVQIVRFSIASGGDNVCGGIVISARHILTLASCEINTTIEVRAVFGHRQAPSFRTNIAWFSKKFSFVIFEIEPLFSILYNTALPLYLPAAPSPLIMGWELTIASVFSDQSPEIATSPPWIICKRRYPHFFYHRTLCTGTTTLPCINRTGGLLVLISSERKAQITFVHRNAYLCKPRYPQGYVNIADFII